MAATTPTAADLYNAAWQAKIDAGSALQAWVAAGHIKSGPEYEAYLAANNTEAAANAAVAAGASAPQTTEEAVARIDANRTVQADVPATVDTAGISALKAEQDRIEALNGKVKDPAVVAEEERISAQVAEIDANRKVQADVPATVDREGIAAAAAAQKSNEQKTVTAADDSNHGTAYDDDGNLNNGWSVSETGDAVWVGAGYNDATGRTAARTNTDQTNTNSYVGPMPSANPVKATASAIPDWRVKLSLAKSATSYLYGAAKQGDILYPLKLTNGVVFPYTPTIQTSYKASYDSAELTHSNYKMHFYKSSSVEDLQITCDFTSQDSEEAAYVLAVIHFFKSVTKMFYGKDDAPKAGTPPPLVYLSGYGQYQFNRHPMLISSFNYSLPNDVDYIRASTGSTLSLSAGAAVSAPNASYVPGLDFIKSRLLGANLNKGGASSQPSFTLKASGEPSYVPTKIQIQLTCLPVVTRNDISKNFSLKDYAAGNLFKRPSGGIW